MNENTQLLLNAHEEILKTIINTAEVPAERLKEAIDYTLFPGGKRIRPLLLYLTGDILNLPLDLLHSMAAAIELTHTYSLVHDDLPAMDNDDYRRGRLSCHKAFDEATAILVGDALQALSLEVLLRTPKVCAEKRVHLTQELLKASGASGMISGQSLDLTELTKSELTLSLLEQIHRLKTGKLIYASVKMPIIAAEPNEQMRTALENFASHLGLVFQMQDDYLDRYAALESLGKNRASDEANKKMTFADFYSKETLATLIEEHFFQVKTTLKPLGAKAEALLRLVEDLQERS